MPTLAPALLCLLFISHSQAIGFGIDAFELSRRMHKFFGGRQVAARQMIPAPVYMHGDDLGLEDVDIVQAPLPDKRAGRRMKFMRTRWGI